MTTHLEIETLPLGPITANAYIVADPNTRDCVIIDATWDAPVLLERIAARGWNLRAIWLTHAHLDHIGAVAGVMREHSNIPLGLHKLDMEWYNIQGGADMFGLEVEPGPEPTLWFDQVDYVLLGEKRFEVLFVPGHAPGHVAFYHRESGTLFGGDVLFQMGIGRWDLPGGNYSVLIDSIRNCFLNLPDATLVYPGHGSATTIGDERANNPFLE